MSLAYLLLLFPSSVALLQVSRTLLCPKSFWSHHCVPELDPGLFMCVCTCTFACVCFVCVCAYVHRRTLCIWVEGAQSLLMFTCHIHVCMLVSAIFIYSVMTRGSCPKLSMTVWRCSLVVPSSCVWEGLALVATQVNPLAATMLLFNDVWSWKLYQWEAAIASVSLTSLSSFSIKDLTVVTFHQTGACWWPAAI